MADMLHRSPDALPQLLLCYIHRLMQEMEPLIVGSVRVLDLWVLPGTSHLPELTLVRLRSYRAFSTRPPSVQSLC